MLSFDDKKEYFESYLLQVNDNYGDEIKQEIYFEFFELEKFSFTFLDNLKTYSEIENKVEFLVSKIILHEHEDGLDNLVMTYCC
jgi:hypothetical protein